MGTQRIFRLLGVRLQRQADELWLLYWPPPAVGTVIIFTGLIWHDRLNGQPSTIEVPFSPLTRRTGIRLSGSSTIVYSKWSHLVPEGFSQSASTSKSIISSVASVLQNEVCQALGF